MPGKDQPLGPLVLFSLVCLTNPVRALLVRTKLAKVLLRCAINTSNTGRLHSELNVKSLPVSALHSTQCTVYSVQGSVYIVHCTCRVQYILDNLLLIAYNKQSIFHSEQCTVYRLQCTVYSV